MTLSRDQHAIVDREVRGLLARSSAFQALPGHERDALVARTAQIASRMVSYEIGGEPAARRRVDDDPYALALEEPATSAPAAPEADRWRPDERFRAEGIAAGVTQAGRMVKEVDFPAFVASLVKGTFQAVVDASIQQMQAYGQLVQSVAQSLDDFADANIPQAEGQRKLISKYPNIFELGRSDDGMAQLQVKDDFDEDAMPNFMAELGLTEPVQELDDDSIGKLVTAARLELARGRQQLLATTILMGINRIIVTDGRINAKIKFDFRAADSLSRDGVRDEYDQQKMVVDFEQGLGDRYVKGHFEKPVPIQVSSTTGASTAELEASAKLSGEVSLNFRSETFPLERMVNADQMFHINNAYSGARGVPAPPAPTVPANPPAPTTPPTTTGP